VDEVRAPLAVEAANAPTVEMARWRLPEGGVPGGCRTSCASTVVRDFVANVATNARW
jgi:hypothetical protein